MADNPFVKNREHGRPKNIRERFKPVRDNDSPFSGFGSNGDPDDNFKRTFRILLYALAMILLFIFLQRLFTAGEQTLPEISYNEYHRLVSQSMIKEIVVEKRDGGAVLTGLLHKYEPIELVDGRTEKKTDRFTVRLLDFDRAMADELVAKNVKIKVEQRDEGSIMQFLIIFGPWIVIGIIYFVIIRRLTAQNGATRNVFNFGKSRA
ncbi:MAG: ATP-dependent metallopeptidase FtsH/Yme1/Tma family protein, partial [Candidatus Thermochlorobacter sp.]